jgi:aminotransferase EvaB
MDVSRLEEAITARTRCILPGHLFGQCVDMDALKAVSARHGVKTLEDCAQSTGAEFRGRRAGSMSDVAAFSFYPTKILGGYGDGGMVVTSDEALASHVRRLRMYGTEGRYYAQEHGYNSRLDEVQAAILQRKLRRLPAYIARRREIAQRYDRLLAGCGLQLPATAPENHHAYYLYVVRHPARDRIVKELASRDIIVNVSYPWPIHTMRGYAQFGYVEGSLPETEAAAREILSLPMYPSLTDADQDRVCEALDAICSTLGAARG